MAIRVPSRTRLEKYGYVTGGETGGPLDVPCPTLISPANDAFILQENVTFSWAAVSGATSYNFYVWEEGAPEPQPINTTSLTYSTTLEFGTNYRWRVNAVNDFGESSGCTYGLVFPDLPPGKSGYNEFEVTQGFVNLEDDFYIVEDSEPSVTINIIRTGTSGPATTEYDTVDGTAVAPGNYTATSGTASWAAGVDGAFPVAIPIEPLALVEELEAEVLPDWAEGTAEPRPSRSPVDYSFDYTYNAVTYSTFAEAKAAAEALTGYSLTDHFGWRVGTYGDPPSKISGLSVDVDPGQREYLSLVLAGSAGADFIGSLNVGNLRVVSREEFESVPNHAEEPYPFKGFYGLGINVNGYLIGDVQSGNLYYLRQTGTVGYGDPDPNPPADGWANLNNCIAVFGCPYPGSGSNVVQALRQILTDISVRRLPSSPGYIGSEFPDWEICPDKFWYDSETDTLYSKAQWEQVNGSYRWLSKYVVSGGGVSTVQRKPLSPCLEVGDPNDTEAFWTAAYNAAVEAGDLPSGMTYDPTGVAGSLLTYPRNNSYAYYRSYKIPLNFTFSISNAVGATIREPDTATVWIVNDC